MANLFSKERQFRKIFKFLENFRQPLERARFEKSHLKSEIRIMEARLIGPFAPSHAFASASCSSGPSHGHSSPANRFETPMGAIIVPSHQVRGPEGPPTEGPSHRGNEPRPRLSSNALSLESEKRERETRLRRNERHQHIYVHIHIHIHIHIYIMHTNFDISRPRDLHAADLKPLKRISSGDLFLARSTCRASSRPRRAETGGGGGGGRVPTYEDRDPPRKHRMEASWQESAAGTRIPGALLLITSNPSTRAPPQRRIPPVFPPPSLSLICQPMAARLNSNSPLPSRPLFTQDKE